MTGLIGTVQQLETSNAGSAPEQVTGLSALSIAFNQINLSWSAASGATTYKVERSLFASSGFSQIANVSSTSYSATGLSAGVQYYFRVRATNSFGDGSYSSTVNQWTRPAQVTGLSASAASSSQINLSWNNPGGTETGFQVYRSTNSNMSGQTLIATTIPNVTSMSVTGLSASTTFYFRVRGINNGGSGAYSSIANATTQAASGNPPTGVSIRATSSSSNNTLNAEQLNTDSLGNNCVDDLLVSDWSSATATMTLNYGPTYSTVLSNNNGVLQVEMYGYIQATGATSYAWDVSGGTVDSDTYSAINSITTFGTASTSQDATGTGGIGEKIKITHNSGGRGYLLLAIGDSVHWDIDATATNSDGSTSATQLTITLEAS